MTEIVYLRHLVFFKIDLKRWRRRTRHGTAKRDKSMSLSWTLKNIDESCENACWCKQYVESYKICAFVFKCCTIFRRWKLWVGQHRSQERIDHQEIFCWIANKVILKLSQSLSLFWNTHVHSYKNKIVWEIASDFRSMKWSMKWMIYKVWNIDWII